MASAVRLLPGGGYSPCRCVIPFLVVSKGFEPQNNGGTTPLRFYNRLHLTASENAKAIGFGVETGFRWLLALFSITYIL